MNDIMEAFVMLLLVTFSPLAAPNLSGQVEEGNSIPEAVIVALPLAFPEPPHAGLKGGRQSVGRISIYRSSSESAILILLNDTNLTPHDLYAAVQSAKLLRAQGELRDQRVFSVPVLPAARSLKARGIANFATLMAEVRAATLTDLDGVGQVKLVRADHIDTLGGS